MWAFHSSSKSGLRTRYYKIGWQVLCVQSSKKSGKFDCGNYYTTQEMAAVPIQSSSKRQSSVDRSPQDTSYRKEPTVKKSRSHASVEPAALSFRDVVETIQMAIIPSGYPVVFLNEDQKIAT